MRSQKIFLLTFSFFCSTENLCNPLQLIPFLYPRPFLSEHKRPAPSGSSSLRTVDSCFSRVTSHICFTDELWFYRRVRNSRPSSPASSEKLSETAAKPTVKANFGYTDAVNVSCTFLCINGTKKKPKNNHISAPTAHL